MLGGQKLKISAKNVVGWGSGYFGCWKLAFRFEVVGWMEKWLDQWYVPPRYSS